MTSSFSSPVPQGCKRDRDLGQSLCKLADESFHCADPCRKWGASSSFHHHPALLCQPPWDNEWHQRKAYSPNKREHHSLQATKVIWRQLFAENGLFASSDLQNLRAAPITTFRFSSVNIYCPLLDARLCAGHWRYRKNMRHGLYPEYADHLGGETVIKTGG